MIKRILSLLIVCIVTILLYSCEKKYIIDVTKTCTNCAEVKILNGNPDPDASFQFYVNDEKVTGSSLAFGDLFPASIEYAGIPSGNDKVTIKVAVNDSTFEPAGSADVSLESGKRYGLVWTGDEGKNSITIIQNRTETPDSGYIMANFINLIKPAQTVDVISSNGDVIFSSVPYLGIKDYVKLPASDTYIVRESGTNIKLFEGQLGLSPTRNYTWYARGIKYDTLSGSPTHIVLDYYTNGYPKAP